MQYVAVAVFIWFLIKSVSFSIYELKMNKNKLGGTICLILTIFSFALALVGVIRLYGQSFLPSSFVL